MNRITRTGMSIAALALCSLALGAAPMHAQDQAPPPSQQSGPPPAGPGGRMNPERQLEMMTKQLNLTPDQVTSIRAIQDDSRKQTMALRDDTTTPQDQKRDKMMAIRTANQAKVRAILTDEQKAKFDAMEARMRERMQNRGGADASPPPPPPQ